MKRNTFNELRKILIKGKKILSHCRNSVVSRASKFDSCCKKKKFFFERFVDDKILQIGIDLFPIKYSLFNNGSM